MRKDLILNEVSFDFEQSQDDCGPSHKDQFLKVQIVDGGAGKYFVLETERWAIESIDDLKDIFDKIGKVIEQFPEN
jgi:hypothetical protein